MKVNKRNELPDDIAIIRKVNEAAFDTNAEADLVDRLRNAGAITLSMVCVLKKAIVGHILFKELRQGALTGQAGIAKYHQLFNEL